MKEKVTPLYGFDQANMSIVPLNDETGAVNYEIVTGRAAIFTANEAFFTVNLSIGALRKSIGALRKSIVAVY